jgi:hypothetical protein
MADRTWVDMLKRQTRELGGLQDAHATEFLRLLRETKADIIERLATGAGSDLDAFMMQRTLAEAEASIAALTRKASIGYTAQQRDAVGVAVEHQGETMGRLSKTFEPDPFSVALDAQKVLADPLQGLLANHFESSVKTYGLDILNGIRRDLFVGMRTGSSLRDITQKIAAKKGPFGELGQAKAARIARTEISQAYGAASLESGKQVAKKVPGVVKTWLHIGSFKCPTCNPLNGTTRPMDGTWTIKGKKPHEIVGPPAHPHCTCRLLFGRPKWRDAMKSLGYLEAQDPDAKPSL